MFIEIIISEYAETILLYVSPRHELFIYDTLGMRNIYNIILSEESIMSGDTDPDIEMSYDEIDTGSVKSHDEDEYDEEIPVGLLNDEQLISDRHLFKQLERLNKCMKSTPYGISMIHENAIYDHMSKKRFDIQHYPDANTTYRAITSMNLETFVGTVDKLPRLNHLILTTIQRMVEKNVHTQQVKTNRLVQMTGTLTAAYSKSTLQSQQYNQQIERLNQLKIRIRTERKNKEARLETLSRQSGRSGGDIRELHNDIDTIRIRSAAQAEIDRIRKLEDDINLEIISIRNKLMCNNICIDNVFAENSILVNQMIKNFKNLSDIK